MALAFKMIQRLNTNVMEQAHPRTPLEYTPYRYLSCCVMSKDYVWLIYYDRERREKIVKKAGVACATIATTKCDGSGTIGR